MKKHVQNRFGTVALALVVLAVSSCNRGYGCPTNFSIDEGWELLLNTLIAMI